MPSFGLPASKIPFADKLVGQIVHFGSLWEIQAGLQRSVMRDNYVVGTIFHGIRGDASFENALAKIVQQQDQFLKLHTASTIMEERFKAWGISPDKIVNIPLGVDLQTFHPSSEEARRAARERLGIPQNVFVVGSFHKDGVGSQEGLEPKLIKGPDVLLEVVSKLKGKMPVFVYLTAPARGYVIEGLRKLGIPYRHDVFEDYHAVAKSYAALDAYLVASREEGGPSGVLEAQASGVPLVSTRVGLAPDLVQHAHNGLLAEVEDSAGLTEHLLALAQDQALSQRLTSNALESIQAYGWPRIAARYYHEIYKPILDEVS
ncbi:MAG: glycosyltransferase family 4 protein [Anaerolineales bacterium]|nr:glycosyltransferase family 4 protein [Anaerolineales bacterium]MCW5855415.1 glycosyltransferase family 4 protein [Anaerolineales bacterium]